MKSVEAELRKKGLSDTDIMKLKQASTSVLLDAYYKKYGLIQTPIDFEFHLDENDVHDAERIDENVRIIEIKGAKVEFGFEHNPGDPKDIVTMSLGFAVVKFKKDVFEEAYKRYKQREFIEEVEKWNDGAVNKKQRRNR